MALGLLLVVPGCGRDLEQASSGGEAEFTVAAASSLAVVVQGLLDGWAEAGGSPARLTLGPSSTLARQLEEGAPYEVFLSADERWIDELIGSGRLDGASRVELAQGRLVVAVQAGLAAGSARTTAASATDGVFPDGRWATGDPAFVPLGQYAREALVARAEWSTLSARMIPAGSARAALRLVERGEVDWGVLYRSDAAGSARVRVLFEVGEELHRPIRYCAAATPRAGASARRFLDELAGREATERFAAHGFAPRAGGGRQR